MATRTIVDIDADRCTGCGDCIPNCAEGALKIIDGVAVLVSDVLCDGMGACLGHCPEDAIRMTERDADKFDEEAVDVHLRQIAAAQAVEAPAPQPFAPPHHAPSCPGSMARDMASPRPGRVAPPIGLPVAGQGGGSTPSELTSWPVQLHLLNPNAPFLRDADLLLCADCVPFALPDFHQRYLSGKRLAIGCPKLDDVQPYLDKLAMMFRNGIRSVTVVRMEVPCCGGLVQLVAQAMAMAGVQVPVTVETVSIRGEVMG